MSEYSVYAILEGTDYYRGLIKLSDGSPTRVAFKCDKNIQNFRFGELNVDSLDHLIVAARWMLSESNEISISLLSKESSAIMKEFEMEFVHHSLMGTVKRGTIP